MVAWASPTLRLVPSGSLAVQPFSCVKYTRDWEVGSNGDGPWHVAAAAIFPERLQDGSRLGYYVRRSAGAGWAGSSSRELSQRSKSDWRRVTRPMSPAIWMRPER